MTTEKIELLAPAKDLQCGIAAIEHGADAVYIGAPQFSARAAASTSLGDIERLVQYGHQFRVQIYVALNTLLKDKELEKAVSIIHKLYECGVDAVIIQDLGLLECDLPPIALHASTQMDNRTLAKVSFLEELGFQQVVLARELSLEQIRHIANHTSVILESFVHGALCVSYSGQCYISEVMAGRSANRGECAQFCRHRFTLKDRDNEIIIKDKYLLSLKDLNLEERLDRLLLAGVRSLKIEGRLKDIHYVKNITALYRQKIDQFLAGNSGFVKSSSGKISLSFAPNSSKTFHRGKTSYFLEGNREKIGAIDSPKSIGEMIGRVKSVKRKCIEVEGSIQLSNGDGLSFFNAKGELTGMRVNRVEGSSIFPQKMVHPAAGTELYRNYDAAFIKSLSQSEKCRKIGVELLVEDTADGLAVKITDEDGCISKYSNTFQNVVAKKPELTRDAIKRHLSKSGDTIFVVSSVEVSVNPGNYYAPSQLNGFRRAALLHHANMRNSSFKKMEVSLPKTKVSVARESIAPLQTLSNSKVSLFYANHGIDDVIADEIQPLMTCKYCIMYELDRCPKTTGQPDGNVGPLLLSDQKDTYSVTFNCGRCEMAIKKWKNDSM